MEEKDVVQLLKVFISNKFPMECSNCGICYPSLAEYLRKTIHVGKPVSYDAEMENWQPLNPIGTLSTANCPCGTTLSITSNGMNLVTMWKLLHWARKESKIRGVETSTLLESIRNKIDESVLQDDTDHG